MCVDSNAHSQVDGLLGNHQKPEYHILFRLHSVGEDRAVTQHARCSHPILGEQTKDEPSRDPCADQHQYRKMAISTH